MINNTINMFSWQINACIEELQNKIKKEDMEECHRFIESQRESRHLKTLKMQQEKFQRLCHKNTGGHSNHVHSSIGIGGHSNPDTTMWPPHHQQQNNITLDRIQDQTQYHHNNNNNQLGQKPIHKTTYQGTREDLKSWMKLCHCDKRSTNRGIHSPGRKSVPKLKTGWSRRTQRRSQINIEENQTTQVQHTKEAARPIKELKKDHERMVLTADKGVSMVVMDRDRSLKNCWANQHIASYHLTQQQNKNPSWLHYSRP